jgi:hyperosmotically inducible periplasmic protein
MRVLLAIPLTIVGLTGCNQTSQPAANAPSSAVTPVVGVQSPRNTPPDNTAVNQRDASPHAKTPIDQKENQADINVTAKIRQLVLDVKNLSMDARNAKIITADGKVTLRGPVKSLDERETLDRIARDVAGEGNVDNQLEVGAAATANPRR